MDLDFMGLRCPQPVLKLTVAARQISPGTMVTILADCPEFPNDLKKWCQKMQKVLLSCTDTGGGKYKAVVKF
jgi:tRNA 2-thiouridine synthesizing protein A